MIKEKEGYYQKTESLLYKYIFIKLGIENMQDEITEEKVNFGLGSADPGKETFKTNLFNSTVENSVISRNDKVKALKQHIGNSKKLIKKIDRVLNKLDKEDREIIRLRYFERLQWTEIEDKLNINERTCRRKVNKAIDKIAIGLAFATITIEVDKNKEAV